MTNQSNSKIRSLAAVVVLVPAALAGCGQDNEAAGAGPEAEVSAYSGGNEYVDTLIEEARQEGELNLNWDVYSDIMPQLIDGFLSMYGLEGDVEVKHTPGASGLAMFTQLEEEYASGRPSQTDIMDGPELRSAIATIGLENDEGFAATLPYTELPNITSDMVTTESQVVTYAQTIPGIAYNTSTVAEEDVPANVDDVVQPDFLEKYTIASTASAAGFDYLIPVWGFQRTCDFATRLGQAADGLIETNAAERIASGEFDALVFEMGIDTKPLADEGAPIDFVIPDGYNFTRTRDFVIPKNAAHPATAQLFISYMLSSHAQDILYDSVGYDSLDREGSKSGPAYDERVSGLTTPPVAIDAEFILEHFFEEMYPYEDVLVEMLQGKHSPDDCAGLEASVAADSDGS